MLGLVGEWKGSSACMINYRIGSYIYRNEYICLHVCGADRTPADTCADSEGGGGRVGVRTPWKITSYIGFYKR